MMNIHFAVILLMGALAADQNPPAQTRRMRVDVQDRIVVDHFEAQVRVGQDRIAVQALDPGTLMFDPERGVVSVRCRDGVRCAERESFRDGILRRSSTYALPVDPDDPTGGTLLGSFRELLIPPAQDTVRHPDVTLVGLPRMITP